MKFTCWNEMCQIEKLCECSNECCQGFKLLPAVIDLDKENRLSEQQKLDLVLHHMCPDCGGWVEC